jgi:hypothetical protein
MSIRYLYLIGVAAILGCASGGTPGTAGTAAPRKGNLLTAAEIAAANADNTTAYDAVARLRPNWLVARGVATQGPEYPVVFVDGQQFGPPESLRGIQAYHVEEIRFYDITQAGARFGIKGGTGGVIEVKSKSGK